MTTRVIIGTSERNLSDIEPNWITEQIIRRKKDGAPICVVVKIKSSGLDMSLASGGCATGGGGGRAPNSQERQFFDLWEKLHLTDADFHRAI